MLGRARVEPDDVDDAPGDILRQVLAQQRHDHILGRQHDFVDRLVADDACDVLGDFLRVLRMEVLDVALIAGLRPAALLVVFGLGPLDPVRPLQRVHGEHEQARRGRVGDDGQITGVFVEDACQRIEVRLV